MRSTTIIRLEWEIIEGYIILKEPGYGRVAGIRSRIV
jgi:hypothetical protein